MAEYQINEELIFEFIVEELDETIPISDKLILQNWRAANAANEQIYLEFLNVQRSINKLHCKYENANTSWNILDKKLISQI